MADFGIRNSSRRNSAKLVHRACISQLVRSAREAGCGGASELRRRAVAALRSHRGDMSALGRILRQAAASAAFAVAFLGFGGAREAGAQPVFSNQTVPAALASSDGYSDIEFADIDADGDLDCFYDSSAVKFFRNDGTASSPVFLQVVGAGNPLNALGDNNAHLEFGDIDDDGDLDCFTSHATIANRLSFFENQGTAAAPVFLLVEGAGDPMDGLNVAFIDGSAALVDIDDDGDLDMFVGGGDGLVTFFRNDGTAASPSFTSVAGAGNPMNGFDGGTLSSLEFADFDGDHDFDATMSDFNNNPLSFFLNTGTAAAPVFVQQFGGSNPFNSFSFPDLRHGIADIDDDGDNDVFLARGGSSIVFLRNDDPNLPVEVSEIEID